MGIGPVPFSSIVQYAKVFGISEFDDFLYYIRLLDNTYLDHEGKKLKAKADGKTSKRN